MALSANSVFEVRPGGNDTNGGGFVTSSSGTDFSQQNAKNTVGNNISTTDAVANGSTTITSATAAFTAAIVGNIIYLQGGTGGLAAGWYHVTTFTNATTIVVDRVVAAGTGITMNIGGALLSIGIASLVMVNGNLAFVKDGPFTISSATPNVAGGTVSTTSNVSFIGYTSTRSAATADTPPVLSYGVAGITLWSLRGLVINLEMDGNGQTTAQLVAAEGLFYRCTIRKINVASGAGAFSRCLVTGNSAAVIAAGAVAFACVGTANTATPFAVTAGGSLSHCLSYGNTGASTDGFSLSNSSPLAVMNCVAYGNGRDGFRIVSTRGLVIANCFAEGNTGAGFNNNNVIGALYLNCSAFSNTGGTFSGGNQGSFQLPTTIAALAGSPFVNAAGADFALNNTAGAGASLRAAGYPGVLPAGGTGFLDIGAVQHADPAQTQGGIRLAGRGGLAAGA